MGVRGELGLVPIKLPPIDVPLVVTLEQDLPFFKRSAVAVALAGAALDDLDPLLAFAVGVCPSVEGVLQNRDDVAVADRRPIERDQLRTAAGGGLYGAMLTPAGLSLRSPQPDAGPTPVPGIRRLAD